MLKHYFAQQLRFINFIQKYIVRIILSLFVFATLTIVSLDAQEDYSFIEIEPYGKLRVPKTLLTKISVHFEEVPFESTLQIISAKGSFSLNYNRNRIPVDAKISETIDDARALDILIKILKKTGTGLLITEMGQLAIVPSTEVIVMREFNRYVVRKGTIKGQVFDSDTKAPLEGVNVLILNTPLGAATDNNGHYNIQNIPVGNYTVQFSYIGYRPVTRTDVIVKSNRITFVNADLKISALNMGAVTVTGSYFAQIEEQPLSSASFSGEEIRRAATIGGDISRIISGLPSLSNENETNNIIARGGSTIENSFYLDNIEIPNINHFPWPGSTGGAVSVLNIDFIKNINIYTGGFSSLYGNVLSSVMDISYREGNREEIDAQFDLNFAGVSGALEGPLKNGNGSYMISARHSFTDIILKFIDDDEEPITYDDFQGKLVYDLSPEHQISFFNFYANDRWTINRGDAINDGKNWFGGIKMKHNTFGSNWRYLWGKKGFSNTSVSYSFLKNSLDLLNTYTQNENFYNHSQNHEFRLRNINSLRINPSHKIEFGLEAKTGSASFDNFFAEKTDKMGNVTPELLIDNDITFQYFGAFLNYKWNYSRKFTLSPGLRIDHFSFNNHMHFAPRLSLLYRMNEKTSFSGAAGVYYQNLPMYFLSQNPDFKDLKDPVSHHFVIGLNHLFSENTRFTLELYNKNYNNLPMNPAQPYLFILDEIFYGFFYSNHSSLSDAGVGFSRGIEAMIQKKLSHKFYGLVSGTYFISRYRDLNGIWRNRVTDNRYLGSLELGYKPNYKWEFSLRWILTGGMPYSPFDINASRQAQTGIYDTNKIMAERLPPYKCFNIRLDRRFHFKNSNLIFYLSIWNLFNRENISYRHWIEYGNTPANYKQWPRLPVFGLEFEF